MRRRAFTLTEVVIAILVLGIMAAAMTLSTSSAKHTAKMEAERVSMMISRQIERADRMHGAFWFMIKNDGFYIFRGIDYVNGKEEKLDFKISSGCKCSAVDSYVNMCYMADNEDKIPTGNHIKISKRNVSVSIEDEAKTATDKGVFNILVTGEGTPAYVVISQNEPNESD